MYGDNPADALGRFARQVVYSGALSLGAGVGVERRGAREMPEGYAVIANGGEAKVHKGPLSAVTDAFTRAGVMQAVGTPGGNVEIKDATIAARLYELQNELAGAQRRLARTASNGSYFNEYEQRQRQRDELTVEELTAERTRLLARNRQAGKVSEAEVGKPGTNWTQVSPSARKKIGPIVRHYMKDAHPFTACVRDNTKRFGPERAKRVCAVVKDMGERRTTWRKGAGKATESAIEPAVLVWRQANRLADEALASLQAAEAEIGREGVRGLVRQALEARGEDGSVSEDERHALGEHLLCELVVLETIARPVDAEVVWRSLLFEEAILEAAFSETRTPRRPGGQFAPKGSAAGGISRPRPAAPAPPPADTGDDPETVAEAATAYERAYARAQRKSTAERKSLTPSSSSSSDFNSKHPRGRSGTSTGGKFIAKGAAGPGVRAVQSAVGVKTDGTFGNGTESAVRAFQRSHGLTVDGVVGRQTAMALLGHTARAKGVAIGSITSQQRAKLKSRGRSIRNPFVNR